MWSQLTSTQRQTGDWLLLLHVSGLQVTQAGWSPPTHQTALKNVALYDQYQKPAAESVSSVSENNFSIQQRFKSRNGYFSLTI